MDIKNIFSSDEFKKQILESEGIETKEIDDSGIEILDALEITDSDSTKFKNIIQSAPVLPKSAKNIILDGGALEKQEKSQKSEELKLALNSIFTKYNQEYGTDLHIDFSSLSNTLVNVADPQKCRILELYLSQVFRSIRPLLILHMIQKLTITLDYILDPQRMLKEFSLADTFEACNQILGYLAQLEGMKDDILIKGSDSELKKIGTEIQAQASGSGDSIDENPVVQEFLKLFSKDTLGGGLSELPS